MKKLWFVHRYRFGEHVKACAMRETFDDLDKLCKRLAEIHGPQGWSYEISDDPQDPRQHETHVALGVG